MDGATYYVTTYYECRRSIELARLGYLLANGRLKPQDASDIIYECQPIAGCFALETVSVDSIVEDAGYRWQNSAEEIRPLAARAARRVWNKWNSTGDIASAAQDWAADLIAEYAEDAGIVLVEGERP